MNSEIISLINYRITRAEEALEEAKILFDSKHFNAAVNRLYYACFYTVSALLLSEGLSSAKHSGVRSLFNQHWVKNGRINKEFGKFYGQIFDHRQNSDYSDFINFDKDQVSELLDETKTFVRILKSKITVQSN